MTRANEASARLSAVNTAATPRFSQRRIGLTRRGKKRASLIRALFDLAEGFRQLPLSSESPAARFRLTTSQRDQFTLRNAPRRASRSIGLHATRCTMASGGKEPPFDPGFHRLAGGSRASVELGQIARRGAIQANLLATIVPTESSASVPHSLFVLVTHYFRYCNSGALLPF